MKKSFLGAFLILIITLLSFPVIAGRCSGDAYCTACSNCSACKHCSEEGGSCGVCSSYEEPEYEVTTEPVIESTPAYSSQYDDLYNSNLDSSKEEEEKSGFGWFWWVVGIGGGIWFLSSLGKK